MIFKNPTTGKYHVSMPSDPSDTEQLSQHYDEKYGPGNWAWEIQYCSYLSPECGYGSPLDKSTCSYCDGTCIRLMKGE